MTDNSAEHRVAEFLAKIDTHSRSMLGYPSARDFSFEELAPLLNYPLNNVGDPFVEGSMHVNSREFECEVVRFWADCSG